MKNQYSITHQPNLRAYFGIGLYKSKIPLTLSLTDHEIWGLLNGLRNDTIGTNKLPLRPQTLQQKKKFWQIQVRFVILTPEAFI